MAWTEFCVFHATADLFAASCEIKLTCFASHEDKWGSGSINQFLPLALLKVCDQLHAPTTSPLEECSLHLLDGQSGYINVRRHAQLSSLYLGTINPALYYQRKYCYMF
jgi:hypothetical protein